MKRKRFEKLLMGTGLQRNFVKSCSATIAAKRVRDAKNKDYSNFSYGNIWMDMFSWECITTVARKIKIEIIKCSAHAGKGRYGLCDACQYRLGNKCWWTSPEGKGKRVRDITDRVEKCCFFDF